MLPVMVIRQPVSVPALLKGKRFRMVTKYNK